MEKALDVDGGPAIAIGNDLKGKISVVAYLIGIPFSFVNQWISMAFYVLVAVTWFIPDRRIEATAQR